MTTIDKLDISVYNLYAIRTKMIEQINQQLQLEKAASIPPQTQLINIYPKLSELDMLLGIVPLGTPWAFFFPPKTLQNLRRSPFSFSRIFPSLGSDKEQDLILQSIAGIECATPQEAQEKESIIHCFTAMRKINQWLGFIVGRAGQFLQG